MSEEKMIEFESRLSWQEDCLTELNKIVYRQQTKIDALTRRCEELQRRLVEMKDPSRNDPVEEKPPHY